MKKKKIRKRLEKAIKARQICKINLEYNPDETCRFLPLKMSEKLVYLIKDGDPVAHGYSVRCLDAIGKVKIEDETVEAAPKEDKKGDMSAPEIDITDWTSVFRSLGKLGQVVVVESEKLTKKEGSYAIGKIEKVGRKQIGIRYYGPDSAWENKKWKIPYEDVTRVTTASRYTEVLSQYVPEGEAEIVADVETEAEIADAEIKAEVEAEVRTMGEMDAENMGNIES